MPFRFTRYGRRVADSAEAIVYGESVRAIDKQEAALEALRARTGTLLAAASLATAFLGGQAFHAIGSPDTRSWVGTVAFVGVAVLAVGILWPWTWIFSTSPAVLIEDHIRVVPPTAPGELRLALARSLEKHWNENEAKLNWLYWAFRAASLSLVFEIVAWLIVLGG